MSLPPGWKQFLAPDGRPYFVDTSTGVSHWHLPAPPPTPPSRSRPAPPPPQSPPRLAPAPAPAPTSQGPPASLAARLAAEYQPPHTYPNGYTPSLYENAEEIAIRTTSLEGDRAFWAQIMDERTGRAASDKLRRFCDGLFFMLDERCEPRRTGRIEPVKLKYLYTLGCHPWGEDSILTQDIAMNPYTMEGFFKGLHIPHQVVGEPPFEHMALSPSFANNGFPRAMVTIDREGFFQWMESEMRMDPTALHILFQHFIKTQGIVDPATRHRFPPIPRSAMPVGRTRWTNEDQAKFQEVYNQGVANYNKVVGNLAMKEFAKTFEENTMMMHIVRQNNLVLNPLC